MPTTIWAISRLTVRPHQHKGQLSLRIKLGKPRSDRLDMLPDEDAEVARPSPTAFLADIGKHPIRRRADFGMLRSEIDMRVESAA